MASRILWGPSYCRAALDAGSAVVVAMNKSDVLGRAEAADALRGLQQQLERMEDGGGIAVTVGVYARAVRGERWGHAA